MKTHSLLFLVILTFSGCSTIEKKDSTFMWPNPKAFRAAQAVADADVYPDTVYQIIDLDKSRPLKVTLGATRKGNGIITIPGLTIRVYDQDNDGIIFDNDGGLICEWRSDFTGSFPILQISGFAIHYDEKGNEVIQKNKVSAVFRYSRSQKSYFAETCSPEIDYWSSK